MNGNAARRADVCGRCGYDLIGLDADRCPECGDAVPKAPPLDPEALARLTRFLARRDIYCKYCKYNLRGIRGNRCPECGTEYYLVGGISRGDGATEPTDPGELAAGCLVMAAVPGALLGLLNAGAAVMAIKSGRPVLGHPAAAIPLGLMPVVMLVALRVLRVPSRRYGMGRRWLAAGAVGVAGVGGLIAETVILIWG